VGQRGDVENKAPREVLRRLKRVGQVDSVGAK
jgi:hypothetical protein